MARYWDVDYEYVGYNQSWDDMQQMLKDGDYSTYNGMRVALLNGSSRDKEFADFADNKGFT